MEGNADRDSHVTAVGLRHERNSRLTPHPISTDPRLGHGYMQERILKNSYLLDARIPGLHFDMFSANDVDTLDNHKMKCCCGRSDCTYLEHNNAALGGLERDLETAARLGQALLSRHESYISESQAEQNRLTKCISELESERLSLQDANEKMVAENRGLLQKLEQLNGDLTDSDLEVKRLESLLLDCEMEVKRLNNLVRRTLELDNRVHEMELERQSLNRQIDENQDETRSSLVRWRESERRVRELEEEVRRIEWEARLDREKHEEIIARLEKERAFERELGGAEGRLKGAAAMQSLDKNAGGSKTVVTHFVRDILQDNANLQAGIAELRQLLQSSNEEVQNLRDQIIQHQPINHEGNVAESRRSISLDNDLRSCPTSPMQHQREVHVHHHYHAKPTKVRPTAVRRPSRRRTLVAGNGNISNSSVPSTPISRPQRYNSSPILPFTLQQQQPQHNRWSMQSTVTMSSIMSSMPSSPRSYHDRGGFLFDRIEQGEESSRPTSPESVGDQPSPALGQRKFRKGKKILDACEEEEDRQPDFNMSPLLDSKAAFDASEASRSDNLKVCGVDKDLTPKPSIVLQTITPSLEETHAEALEFTTSDRVPSPRIQSDMDGVPTPKVIPDPENATNLECKTELSSATNTEKSITRKASRAILNNIPEIRPSLVRKSSHETLVSISGMDIHIAQRANSTATLELLHDHFAHSPAQSRRAVNAQPIASVTEYTATSTPMSVTHNSPRPSSRQVPSSIEALSGIVVPKPRATRIASQPGAIGRIGGWVRGRWGIAPMKSSGDLRSVSLNHDALSIQSNHSSGIASTDTEENQTCPMMTVQTITATDVGELANTGATTLERPVETISIPQRPLPNPLHAKVDPMILFAGRSPGINQPGIIPGFRATVMNKRTPSQVMASVIDEEGLKDGLAE